MPQINVLEYLERQAAERPDKLAFADDERRLTFAQLRESAMALAGSIARLIGGRTRLAAAVSAERSVLSLVGFFAVLYSGNFYVPLDTGLPASRKSAIMDKTVPALLITVSDSGEEDAAEAGRRGIPTLRASLGSYDGSPLPWRGIIDLDPVYVLFTSGSTGEPKGIVVTHRAVIDFTDWLAAETGVDDTSVMGNQTPFFFDASVKDIYLTLKCGATTHILPKKCFMFPKLLIDRMNTFGVNSIFWATSAFHLAAASGILQKSCPGQLRLAVLGGETLSARHLRAWREACPDAVYYNLYGPTEITVDCTYYKIDRDFADGEAIPIGFPCPNKQVMLLDDKLKPVPQGCEGEICVRGSGVSPGYYNEPDKTAAAFVQNPAIGAYADIIYRTGDIGVADERGCITFVSRRDGQVKHNGYRIGLGETERAMTALAGVDFAVCLFDRSLDRIICVYSGDAEESGIIPALKSSLPKYMLPNRLIKLERMPETPNGKLDRARLAAEYLT